MVFLLKPAYTDSPVMGAYTRERDENKLIVKKHLVNQESAQMMNSRAG